MRVENVREVMIKPHTDQEKKKNETKKTEGEEEGERRVGRSSNSTQEKRNKSNMSCTQKSRSNEVTDSGSSWD
jgi:hypothetical protein